VVQPAQKQAVLSLVGQPPKPEVLWWEVPDEPSAEQLVGLERVRSPGLARWPGMRPCSGRLAGAARTKIELLIRLLRLMGTVRKVLKEAA
jgi:hypothetical protein